jgi:hypothetical protein
MGIKLGYGYDNEHLGWIMDYGMKMISRPASWDLDMSINDWFKSRTMNLKTVLNHPINHYQN